MAFSLTGILCREMTACLQRHLVGPKTGVLCRIIGPVDVGYRVRFLAGSSGNDVRDFRDLTSQSHRVGLSQNPNKLKKPTKDIFPFVTKEPTNPTARFGGLKSKLKHSKGIATSTTSSFAKSLKKAPAPNITTQAFKEVSGARNDVNIFVNEGLSGKVTEQLRIVRGKDETMQLDTEIAPRAPVENVIVKGNARPGGEGWKVFESGNDFGAKKNSSKKNGARNKSGHRLKNELGKKDGILLDKSNWNKTRVKTEVKAGDSEDVPLGLAFVSRDNKMAASGGKTERRINTRQLISDLQDNADISVDLRDSEVTSSSMSHVIEKAQLTDNRMGSTMGTSDKNAKPDWPSFFDLYNNSLEKSQDVTQSLMPKAWLELEEQSSLSERRNPPRKDLGPKKGNKRQWQINEEDFMVNGTGISHNLSSNPESHRIKQTATRYGFGVSEKENMPFLTELMASEKATKTLQSVKTNKSVQSVHGRKSVPQPLLCVTPQDMAKGKPVEGPDGQSKVTFYRQEEIVAQMADRLGREIHVKNKLPKVEEAFKAAKVKEKSALSKDRLEVFPKNLLRENLALLGKTSVLDIKVPRNKSKNQSPLSKEDGGRSSHEPLLCVTAQEMAKASVPLKSQSVRTRRLEEANQSRMINGELNQSEMINGKLNQSEMINGKLNQSEMINGKLNQSEMINGKLKVLEKTEASGHLNTLLNEEKENSPTGLSNTTEDQIRAQKRDESESIPDHWYLDYIKLHERKSYITDKNEKPDSLSLISKPVKDTAKDKGVDSKPCALHPSITPENVSLGFLKHTPQLEPNPHAPKRPDCTTESPYLFVIDSLDQNPPSQPSNELLCCKEQPVVRGTNQNGENLHPVPTASHDKKVFKDGLPLPTASTDVSTTRKAQPPTQKSTPLIHPMETISEDFLWLADKVSGPQNPSDVPKVDVESKFHRDVLKTYVGEKVEDSTRSPSTANHSNLSATTLLESESLNASDVFTTRPGARPGEKVPLKSDSLNTSDIFTTRLGAQPGEKVPLKSDSLNTSDIFTTRPGAQPGEKVPLKSDSLNTSDIFTTRPGAQPGEKVPLKSEPLNASDIFTTRLGARPGEKVPLKSDSLNTSDIFTTRLGARPGEKVPLKSEWLNASDVFTTRPGARPGERVPLKSDSLNTSDIFMTRPGARPGEKVPLKSDSLNTSDIFMTRPGARPGEKVPLKSDSPNTSDILTTRPGARPGEKVPPKSESLNASDIFTTRPSARPGEKVPLKSDSLNTSDIFTTQPGEKVPLKSESLNTSDIFTSVFEAQLKDAAKRKKEKKPKEKQQNEVSGAMNEDRASQCPPGIRKPILKSVDGFVTMTATAVREDEPPRKIWNDVPLPYSDDVAVTSGIQSSKRNSCWPIAEGGTDGLAETNTIFLNEQMKRLDMALAKYHERSKRERASRVEKKDNGKRDKNNKKRPKRDKKSQAGKLYKAPPGVNV